MYHAATSAQEEEEEKIDLSLAIDLTASMDRWNTEQEEWGEREKWQELGRHATA